MDTDFRIKFSDPTKAEFIAKIKNSELFNYYYNFNKELEKNILLCEIEELLDKELTFADILEIQSLDASQIDEYDFKQLAKLCMQVIFDDVVENNQNQVHSLGKHDALFNQTLKTIKKQIIEYLEGKRTSFPKDTLRCFYLLSDNQQQVRSIALYLMYECVTYCSSLEMVEDLKYNIFEHVFTY